jgi:choline kinase
MNNLEIVILAAGKGTRMKNKQYVIKCIVKIYFRGLLHFNYEKQKIIHFRPRWHASRYSSRL